MFSGHATYFTLLFLFNKKYNFYFNVLVFIVGNISIISGHLHYSVDVIIGIVLSILVFNNY